MDILLGLTLMVGVIIFGGILLYKTINPFVVGYFFDLCTSEAFVGLLRR